MSAVSAPDQPQQAPKLWVPEFRDRLPGWAMRLPVWARILAFLVVLMAVSLFIRTRYIGGQLWMNEATIAGISSHSLTGIPGVLWHDGSPPLYFWLLHLWREGFGNSENAMHGLSLLFGMLAVPIAMWAGWSLFGVRAGVIAAVMFAFSAYITDYSQEVGMYSLMALLGLVATTAFLHAFVYRRRGYVIVFGAALTVMMYTHAWAIFYLAATALALLAVMRICEDPRAIVRDGAISLLAPIVLFIPWLPTFIHQLAHSTEPWDSSARYGGPKFSRDLLGGDRVTVAATVTTAIGVAPLLRASSRRSREAQTVIALVVIIVAALVLAVLFNVITPVWVPSYFGPVIGPLLLLVSYGLSRSGIVGAVAVVLCIAFLANPASYTPKFKSDMQDVSAEISPLLHSGDLVISAQPEQMPLVYYYLPQGAGLRYADTLGPTADPAYVNWDGAYTRLLATSPRAVLDPLVASLRRGQQLLYVRPLTEGEQSWKPAWTQLVRLRAAQWGAILQSDVARGILQPETVAPHNYRGSCCVADSAVLYKKVS